MTDSMRVRNRKLHIFLLSALVLLVALLSITNRSLWIDEVCRVSDAAVGDFRRAMRFGFNCAQPGYVLLMYLWARLFPGVPGEFALRCSNLVFTAIALFFAFRIVEKKKWPLWTVLVFFVHPMFTYYANETTPYILMYALALAFVDRVYFAEDFSAVGNVVRINVIFFLGVSVHFIFGFLIVPYLVQCFLKIRKEKKLVLRHAGIMAAFCVLYLPLLYLYMKYMEGASTGFSLRNVLYVVYAFLGMAGLALSRTDLRAGNFGSLTPLHIALLALFVLVAVVIFVICLRKKPGFLKKNRDLALGGAAFLTAMILAAIPAHFGMWERHCMTIFPIYCILLTDMMLEIGREKTGRIALIALYVLLVFSCANLRLNADYATDDMRAASARVREAYAQTDDLTVISDFDFAYYPVSKARTGESQGYVYTYHMPEDEILSNFETAQGKGSAMLVLSEHYASRALYRRFDDDSAYRVDASCKGYKIVTPAGQDDTD